MKKKLYVPLGIALLGLALTACDESSSTDLKELPTTAAAATVEESEAEEVESDRDETYSVFITSADLNVRAGVGTSYKVITTAPKNTELQLTGNEDQTESGGTWYEVVLPDTGDIGWVSSKYGTIKEIQGTPVKVDVEQLKKQNDLKQALSNLKPEEDKVSQTIFYKPKNYPKYINERTFVLPYIATKNDKHTLHLKINYFNSDWVFWDKLIFAVDDYRYEKSIGFFSTTQDVADNGVLEIYDMSNLKAEEIELLRSIAKSNETIIRFQGEDHRYDFTVPSSDKKAIQQVLDAYDALEANK